MTQYNLIENVQEKKHPTAGEYWKIRDQTYPFVVIESVEPEQTLFGIKYFKSSTKMTGMCFKNEELYAICLSDLDYKVAPPKEKRQGRRTFYYFEESQDGDIYI